MASYRVSLLRGTAALFAVAALAAAPAAASNGGAPLPGGALPSVVDPLPADETPADGSTSFDAQQVAVEPSPPALAELPTVARLPTDPMPTDLAALAAPSPLAAVDGHVVVVRPRLGRSELVDVGDPAGPRTLLVSTRVFGTPTAGHDEAGRPVIVVSPCAGVDEVVLQGQTPRCPLRLVDLQSGATRAVPATTGALAGDLEGTQLVFSRASPATGVRLYARAGAAAPRALAPPPLGGAAAVNAPLAGSVRASSLDIDAAGRIAVVLDYRSRAPAATSSLWLRATDGAWTRLTAVGTPFTGQGTRRVLGPLLDASGATAYVEGVVDTPSFMGHWTSAGVLTAKVSVRRSIGRATILFDAAFDEGRLRFVDWLPGAPCGAEGALACGVRSLTPLSLG